MYDEVFFFKLYFVPTTFTHPPDIVEVDMAHPMDSKVSESVLVEREPITLSIGALSAACFTGPHIFPQSTFKVLLDSILWDTLNVSESICVRQKEVCGSFCSSNITKDIPDILAFDVAHALGFLHALMCAYDNEDNEDNEDNKQVRDVFQVCSHTFLLFEDHIGEKRIMMIEIDQDSGRWFISALDISKRNLSIGDRIFFTSPVGVV